MDASEDIERHRLMMGVGALPEDGEGLTCPYLFTVPCSPHLAAEIDGTEIDPGADHRGPARFGTPPRIRVVRRGGGALRPAQPAGIPRRLVGQAGFAGGAGDFRETGEHKPHGVSLELCRMRGIDVAAVVYNYYPDVLPEIEKDTVRVIPGLSGGKIPGVRVCPFG